MAQWRELRTLDQETPGKKPVCSCACRTMGKVVQCSYSFSVTKYLAMDSGGYLCTS